MITCLQFYQLSYDQQADLLLKDGKFLESKTEGGFIMDFYKLEGLLIEVFFEKATEELISIKAWETKDRQIRDSDILAKDLLQPKIKIKHGNFFPGSYARVV